MKRLLKLSVLGTLLAGGSLAATTIACDIPDINIVGGAPYYYDEYYVVEEDCCYVDDCCGWFDWWW